MLISTRTHWDCQPRYIEMKLHTPARPCRQAGTGRGNLQHFHKHRLFSMVNLNDNVIRSIDEVQKWRLVPINHNKIMTAQF